MLRELRIKNLAIIDNITLEFEKGLNALTGETGAGKSIIINALSLAMGERASGELIRSGEKEAVVEAFFDIPDKLLNRSARRLLQDMGIDSTNGILMKRILSSKGKSRAYINDSMVNVQTLAEVSPGIIDIHGQYEHQSLLLSDTQIDLVDAYGGILRLRQEVTDLYETQAKLRNKINGLIEKDKERAQRLDILEFQINEINSADLRAGEQGDLTEESKILGNASRLAELANQAYELLYSSETACIANLSKVFDSLKEISLIDSKANESVKSIEGALPLLEEPAYFLRDYRDSLDADPGRLDAVYERLELIKRLLKKYGNDIKEVLAYREKALKELDTLKHSEERIDALNSELKELKNKITEKAQLLSKKRKETAKKVEHQVKKALSKLSMADTEFLVKITNETGDDTTDGFRLNSKGIDRLEFLISPNVGEEIRPLSKIASGGELSRIMLALKEIFAKGDRIPVLVFDEIDAGIGGKTAETVGQKLKTLSSGHQVICITHLPQIASCAGTHLKIEKKISGKRTIVKTRKIQEKERALEIARMLGGDGSEVSIAHAKEMLKSKRRGTEDSRIRGFK